MKVHGQILDVARGFSLCERVEAESSWMKTLEPGREAAAERALQWLSVAALSSTNDSRSQPGGDLRARMSSRPSHGGRTSSWEVRDKRLRVLKVIFIQP